MTDLKLDWDLLEWVKPSDYQILQYSRGKPLTEYSLCVYQHVNWAYKELGMVSVVNMMGDANTGFGVLVAYCQRYVKENDLKEPEVVPVEVEKKKGWFCR